MKQATKERIAGIIILTCAAIVIFWEGAGLLAKRSGDDYALKAEDFEDFQLELPGWKVQSLPVNSNFQEVNLLKLRLRKLGAWSMEHGKSLTEDTKKVGEREEDRGQRAEGRGERIEDRGQRAERKAQQPNNLTTARDFRAPEILVRLVHGYNMVDCMRIKGYEVQKLHFEKPETGNLTLESNSDPDASFRSQPSGLRFPPELWSLTSSAGDESLWMSGILRAGDFAAIDSSVKDMPFPRVGIPTDPKWVPSGISWKSLKHPIRNFKYVLRAKWNGSRCDTLTFLGLRRPAWASDDSLTFLVILDLPQEGAHASLLPPNEDRAMQGKLRSPKSGIYGEHAVRMKDIYLQVLRQMQEWKNSEDRG